uniref:A-kinase anchoring protein 12 n=1 Tax=Salvator merianae TaxID=96440 RepID=A0A8D0KP69_SALMN
MLGAITLTVAQRETTNVIVKEESAENMETKPSDSTDKVDTDAEKGDTQDAEKQLPSEEDKAEELEQPSESPSNDVGFKKVFKFVGFKFTVRKDKTEKVEPVQLLNVKADDTEGAKDGAGDFKEITIETVEEETQSDVPCPVEKTEQETQTEQMKEEISPEKVTESPTEAGSKEAEMKTDGSKSPGSPTSPLANETASPLRKFFSQGWAGFRKRTSFRKPKEEEQHATEKEKQEQEKDVSRQEQERPADKEPPAVKEDLEKEKSVPQKEMIEASVQVSDGETRRENGDGKETEMVDVSTETYPEEAVTSPEQPSAQKSTESINKESETGLKKKIDLSSVEKLEPIQECLIAVEQGTPALTDKNIELIAPVADKVCEQKIDQSEPSPLTPVETPEEHFEIIGEESEAKAPLTTEIVDKRPTEINIDVITIEKKEEPKLTGKLELVLEQTDTEKEQLTDEQLKVKELLPETGNEQLKQTELSSGDTATFKPPEGITSEVELLSSQERVKMQGSPLKKLFTGTGLKKLSGKKHKGKREEAKSGESAEQMQQLSDSAESPEDPRGESSASSPEEVTESVEKATDTIQMTENEEGATSDMEKKNVTPWASFKKMVTPKKRVRRLSESDKEEELEKGKSATLSSTESAPCEEQEDTKENGEEQKLEKSVEEPKRKVDTSVSWEALICVGSSKKRTRKSSSSDEEVGQRLGQEGQKIEENGQGKETAPHTMITSSQESDQGQGNSSPEQAGSPSEGEGVSTWESFKRLVTPRRKSRSKMEERNEESAPSLEHSTSDGDSGKEESWVSFKKLMPGRRKKKSDGIPEHAPVQEAGEEMTEANEEDSDVPAVVPLSEYEAAEQEKIEIQKAKQTDVAQKTSDHEIEESDSTFKIDHSNEGLVHAVTVTVVEGERAVTCIEERSPSWISAAVTEAIEHVKEDEEKQTEKISEIEIVEEAVVVTKCMPEMRKDVSGETILSELESTSEAVTAHEEALGAEEVTEVSCAEETTEMVSAVSRLTDSPDTTEIATPVQEGGESQQNLEELNKQTEEILQEVAERVKLSEEIQEMSQSIQPVSVEKRGQELSVVLQGAELKELEPEKTCSQVDENLESGQSQVGDKENGLEEVLKDSGGLCEEVKEISKEITSLEIQSESHDLKTEQEIVERLEAIEEIMTDEKSEEEEFVIVTVTPEEEVEVKVDDSVRKQQVEVDNEEYGSSDRIQEVKTNVEEAVKEKITEDAVPKVDLSATTAHEENPPFSEKPEQAVNVILDLASKLDHTEIDAVEIKSSVVKEVKEVEVQFSEVSVPAALLESKVAEAPVHSSVSTMDIIKHTMSIETDIQKIEHEVQLQKLESSISLVDVSKKVPALTTEAQMPVKEVEVEVEVHKQDTETDRQRQKVCEEMEKKSPMQIVEAEVVGEKAQLKVDMETPPDMVKAEMEEHKPEKEVHTSVEEKHTKLDIESHPEKMSVETVAEKGGAEVAKTERQDETSIEQEEMKAPIEEAEAPVEKTNGISCVCASTGETESQLDSEPPAETEEIVSGAPGGKAEVHTEASIEKTGAKLETEVFVEKPVTAALPYQAEVKLEENTFVEQPDKMLPLQKEDASFSQADAAVDAEVPAEKAKAKDEEVSAEQVDVDSCTEKTGTEIAKKTSEIELPAEEVEKEKKADTSVEKTEASTGVEILMQEDTKVEVKVPEEKVKEAVTSEQSEVMVEVAAIVQHPELKGVLENVENEVLFQSKVTDTTHSLATCVEVIPAEAPVHVHSEQTPVVSDKTAVTVQRELQDVSSSSEMKSVDVAAAEESSKSDIKEVPPALGKILAGPAEEPAEKELVDVSAPKQDAGDLAQDCVAGDGLPVELQYPEKTAAEVPIVKDIMLVDSKCPKESVIEASELEKTQLPPVTTEVETLKYIDIGTSEGLVEHDGEDTGARIRKDPTTKEAPGISMEQDLGKAELIAETRTAPASEEGEGVLRAESESTETVGSNGIMEHKESTLPSLKVREAAINGTSEQTERSLGELSLKAEQPFPESTSISKSCQRTPVLSEKPLIKDAERSAEETELAGGDVLHTAPVQQDFTEQQEFFIPGTPELQSYSAQKSSVRITNATIEEKVISESTAVKEMSHPSLDDSKATALKEVQEVSFSHPGLGAADPGTEAVSEPEKTESVGQGPVLPGTEDHLIPKHISDSVPEMKFQKLELEQQVERKATPLERSPSLTHIEFQKDVVQSVTIESQSTKIVLKIIQNAVDKLEETEEPASTSKKQGEPQLTKAGMFEAQKDRHDSQQLPIKAIGDESQEVQPSVMMMPESVENREAFKMAEVPLTSGKSDGGKSCDFYKTDVDQQLLKHLDEQSPIGTTPAQNLSSVNETVEEVKEETVLQKEKGEAKLQSELDSTDPARTQKAAGEGTVSRDLPKESLEAEQPKLKDAEAEQTVQIQEQCIEQQTRVKRKEEASPSTEFVEMHTEEDLNSPGYSACESLQLKPELSES